MKTIRLITLFFGIALFFFLYTKTTLQLPAKLSNLISTTPLPSQTKKIYFPGPKSDLPILTPEPITIRGFLYQGSNGDYILSDEPNLKTCCIGKLDKGLRQILIKSEHPLPKTDHVVTLRGFISPSESPPYRYQLDHASLE